MMKSEQTTLFPTVDLPPTTGTKQGKTIERLKRLDTDAELRERIIPYCRLDHGEIWEDATSGHRVGVLDATNQDDIDRLMGGEKTGLIVNDPPYNVAVGNSNTANLSKIDLASYLDFSKRWVACARRLSKPNTHLYIWMGTDYKEDFQPLPDFMILDEGISRFQTEELHHTPQSAGLRYAEKLDVGTARTTSLRER